MALGALILEEYGGLGLGLAECGVMMQEIAASGAGPVRLGGPSTCSPPAPVIRHGAAEMNQEFLPRLARGEILTAFGVTEPTAGVDISGITTKAEKVAGGWVVKRPEDLNHQRTECPQDPAAGMHACPQRGNPLGARVRVVDIVRGGHGPGIAHTHLAATGSAAPGREPVGRLDRGQAG